MHNAIKKTNQSSVINKKPIDTGKEMANAVRADSCLGLRFLGFTCRYCSGKLLELNRTLQLKGQIYNQLL